MMNGYVKTDLSLFCIFGRCRCFFSFSSSAYSHVGRFFIDLDKFRMKEEEKYGANIAVN